jgi:hypothetical protein
MIKCLSFALFLKAFENIDSLDQLFQYFIYLFIPFLNENLSSYLYVSYRIVGLYFIKCR